MSPNLISGFILLFFLGASIASFLGNISFRLGHDRPLWGGRSQCDHCAKPLPWWTLIPVLGYLLTRGKCAQCGRKVPAKYPLFELFLGATLCLGFLRMQTLAADGFFTTDWLYAGYFVFIVWIVSALGMLAIYDIDYLLILDRITYPAIALTALLKLLLPGASPTALAGDLLAGVISAAFIWFIVRLTRERGMGFGDIKLALLVGLIGGWPNGLMAIWIAFVLGAVIGLLLVAAKQKGLRTQIPFGPFLSIGGMISFLYGDILMHWYFSQFLLI